MRTIPVPPVPEITGPITVTWRGTTYLRRTVLGVDYWTVA